MRADGPKLLIVAVALIVAPAVADALGAEPISVRKVLQLHRYDADLAIICRTADDVPACTAFRVESFDCRCEKQQEGWGIVVRVGIVAEMHARDRRYLNHETLHVNDVREGVERQLQRFVDLRFDDAAGCLRMAEVMSIPQFSADLMYQLIVASNDRFGCSKKSHTQRSRVAMENGRRHSETVGRLKRR
jgi:hypothetical protein